jgi:hypothetical protein
MVPGGALFLGEQPGTDLSLGKGLLWTSHGHRFLCSYDAIPCLVGRAANHRDVENSFMLRCEECFILLLNRFDFV